MKIWQGCHCAKQLWQECKVGKSELARVVGLSVPSDTLILALVSKTDSPPSLILQV